MTDYQFNYCCCPSVPDYEQPEASLELSRRSFLAMGGVFMGGLTYGAFQDALQSALDTEPVAMPFPRKPLIVKPVLVYDRPQYREKTLWRGWGEIHTDEAANEEVVRIQSELATLKQQADYPVEFLEISAVTHMDQMRDHPDMKQCDTILLYGAGSGIGGIRNFEKEVIVFQRWHSGPAYLQCMLVSPVLLRQNSDSAVGRGIYHNDIVTDKTSELDWRFRALCGLKNTKNAKIATIGGAGAWGQNREVVLERIKNVWSFEYHNVSHDELRQLFQEAQADETVMTRAKNRADAYLNIPGTKLETAMEFVVRSFVLDDLLRLLMKNAGANLITIQACGPAIIASTDTTPCLALSTLNDDGYMAFCESDFVAIPSGVLLGNITGKPVFLGNPLYPLDGVITVSHCTAPRKMDGKNFDPARIMTHYESDYGVATHVEAPIGTKTTHIVPAFNVQRWLGLRGTIANIPFRQICRTQFDIQYEVSDKLLAERMPGFHWLTCYGDYRKEVGYALRRVGIQWDNLDDA